MVYEARKQSMAGIDYSKHTLSMEDKMAAGAFGRARNTVQSHGYLPSPSPRDYLLWKAFGGYTGEYWRTWRDYIYTVVETT